MKKNPAVVVPSDLLSIASQIMLWAGGRHLPVVDQGRVVGVVSSRDIFRALANPQTRSQTVRAAMSSPAQTIAASASVEIAARQMVEHRVGCLPVVDGHELIGIITTTDMLNILDREHAQARESEMSAQLKHELARLRTLRDHVKVQAHLGGMELREVWATLENEFAQAERHATNVGDAALQVIRVFRERAEQTYAKLIRGLVAELEATTKRTNTNAKAHRESTS